MAGWQEEEGAEHPPSPLEEKEMRISALALRYRSGEREALAALYQELEPAIRGFLRAHLTPYRSLPSGVEAEDLYQQAYVALAEGALDWDPGRNENFVPYFLHSFPWRIDRYLRSVTPSRRAATVRLRSVPHDILMDQVGDVAGTDGRDWSDSLAWEELVEALPTLYRRVVGLHLYRGLPFGQVGNSLGISRSAAHEAFTRAAAMLRTALAEEEAPGPPSPQGRSSEPGKPIDEALLRRSVEIIHRLSPGGSPLPGRQSLCRMAGLTWGEYREIIARLQSAGCVSGRRRGSSGFLVCSTPSETLERLDAYRWPPF